jgi:hypothetical protein
MWHRVEVVLTDVSYCILHSHRRENLKSYKYSLIQEQIISWSLSFLSALQQQSRRLVNLNQPFC